jgi:putative transcriptional regulator
MEKQKVKCTECGGAMRSRRENYAYESLPTVTLKEIEVRECPHCGEVEYVVPRVEELDRVLAEYLLRSDRAYSGAEIRFLRKFMGWSGEDFAGYIGVSPEAVSRWENNRTRMGMVAQRLLRLLVLTREPVDDYELHELKKLTKKAIGKNVVAAMKKNRWAARAA